MGDTKDALAGLTSGGGIARDFIVAIEGHSRIYTTGSTSAALTAWAATDHTAAQNGIVFQWGDGQTVKPWSKEIDVPIMSFGVQPDVPETSTSFGVLVGARDGGSETILDIEPSLTSTTINVLSTAAFPSSGEIMIGTETIAYASKTDTSFTSCTRGMYAPGIELDIGGWPRPHSLPLVTQGVSMPVLVTSQIRDWRGRVVTVWLHRKVAGVLDVKAEAECVFVGRILGTREDSNGWTWVDIENLNAVIRSKRVLHDQWTSRVREGIYVRSGLQFNALDTLSGTTRTADPLEVLDSGAAGHLEMDEGVYELSELTSIINEWLQGERDAGNLGLQWTLNSNYADDDGSRKSAFLLSGGAASGNYFSISLPEQTKRFFGFQGAEMHQGWNGTGTLTYKSPHTPRRILIFENDGLPVEDVRGTAFDNEVFAPSDAVAGVNGTVMIVQETSSGAMFAAELTSATRLDVISQSDLLDRLTGVPWTGLENILEVKADDERELRLRQVAVIGGSFRDLVMYFLASTGGDSADVNGADYDKLPAQLGAGIPLELISSLSTDLASIQGGLDDRIVVIERPRDLWDILWGEFLVRASALVWRDGVIRLATWSTPTSSTAVHTFNEANKAEPSGTKTGHRTVPEEDDSFVVNVVTVYYDRVLTGSGEIYRSDFTIKDLSAMEATGERKAEIKLPCTFETSNSAIDSLMGSIAAWLPLFTRPVWVLDRSIDMTKYLGVAPGDQGLLSDNFIRDPSDGTRGVTDKPILVLSHRVNWGGLGITTSDQPALEPMIGQVELIMMNRDRIAPYSPCAQVDHTAPNGGYDAGTFTLTCAEHEHSESSQAVDASNFSNGPMVTIVEIDPPTLASPLTWTREVDAVSGNDVALTSGLSSPAWDSTKKYRIISQPYIDATSEQQAHVYQASATNGLIQEDRGPYEYGYQANQSVIWTDDTDTVQVDLPATLAYGDGRPLDVGFERSMFRLANNFTNYAGGGVSIPSLGAVGTGTAGKVRSIVFIEPICLGNMDLQNGERLLWERPFFRSSTGGSATVYVSLCRGYPFGNSRHITDATNPAYILGAPFETQSWTTTSTTWAAGAAASFSLSVLNGGGKGYIVYELTPLAETRGASTRRVGPYVEAA